MNDAIPATKPVKAKAAKPKKNEPWLPESLKRAPKQLQFFNSYKMYNLVSGPRLSGKSFACEHKVMRHLWETPGAYFGLFSNVLKTAKDGGVWDDFMKIIIPEWVASGMVGETGLPIAITSITGAGEPGPKMDASTRTVSIRIRNWFGGESELALSSLPNEAEAEVQLKQRRFSGLWFIELSAFELRSIFNLSIQQLRMPHLRRNQHIWIGDTNPAPEGTKSWIYRLWYEERVADTDDPDAKLFRKDLNLLEIFLEDNPFLDPAQVAALKGSYLSDPGDYDRFVLGKWTAGHGNTGKLFADLIFENIHFIAPAIDVSENTIELKGGWDIGSVNHAACALEKRFIKEQIIWLMLEEHVVIGQEVSISEFAYEMYQKILKLQAYYKKTYLWTHWADNSAISCYRPGFDGVDATEVLKATGGKIELVGADKGKGSVGASIRLLRRLLKEERLFVGKNCPHTEEMLWEIKHGKNEKEEIDKGSRFKHIFDALRYPIMMESKSEMMEFLQKPRGVNRQSGLIQIE